MSGSPDLQSFVPESCRDLIQMSDVDLKTSIPELARDKGRMGDIEKAIKELPTHHELYQGDSRDLSMVEDESVHLVVSSPPYFNLKDYNGGGSAGQGRPIRSGGGPGHVSPTPG